MTASLLSCDPGLAMWRETNYLLYVVIGMLFVVGMYVTFKPRVEVP